MSITHNVIALVPKGEKDIQITIWSQGVPRVGEEISIKGVLCTVERVRWVPEFEGADGPLRATIYLDSDVPVSKIGIREQERRGAWLTR